MKQLKAIIGLTAAATIGLAARVVQVSLYPKRKSYLFSRNNEIANGNFTYEYDQKLEYEEVYLSSQEGYKIYCRWIPTPSPAEGVKRAVVIAHGYTYTLYGSYKYMKMFHKLGYDVLLYDQRYHGKSGGSNCTFGYKESRDLATVVDEAKRRVGPKGIVGTHGESLGGATILLHGVKDKRLDFVISDCAFSSMGYQVGNRLNVENHLPRYPFIWLASMFQKVMIGGSYKDSSPDEVIHKMTTPTMIIHGKKDKYTTYEQGERLYRLLNCKKKFYGAEGAGHAQSYASDRDLYQLKVKEFLDEIIDER